MNKSDVIPIVERSVQKCLDSGFSSCGIPEEARAFRPAIGKILQQWNLNEATWDMEPSREHGGEGYYYAPISLGDVQGLFAGFTVKDDQNVNLKELYRTPMFENVRRLTDPAVQLPDDVKYLVAPHSCETALWYPSEERAIVLKRECMIHRKEMRDLLSLGALTKQQLVEHIDAVLWAKAPAFPPAPQERVPSPRPWYAFEPKEAESLNMWTEKSAW